MEVHKVWNGDMNTRNMSSNLVWNQFGLKRVRMKERISNACKRCIWNSNWCGLHVMRNRQACELETQCMFRSVWTAGTARAPIGTVSPRFQSEMLLGTRSQLSRQQWMLRKSDASRSPSAAKAPRIGCFWEPNVSKLAPVDAPRIACF